MRKLIFVIFGAIAAVAIFINVDWRGLDLNFSFPATAADLQSQADDDTLWYDFFTVMEADGHRFALKTDETSWGGWYLDSTRVGDDLLLEHDSIGPSKLRLDLVTKSLEIDITDPDAKQKLIDFLSQPEGFLRSRKYYSECLDSVTDEEKGTLKYMGHYAFLADYVDSGVPNAAVINKFVCNLANFTNLGDVDVPPITALYIGYNPNKYQGQIYTDDYNDIPRLSEFLANKTLKEWRLMDVYSPYGASVRNTDIRARVVTPEFITFSVYDLERHGTGHGMYVINFYTLNLRSGKAMNNSSIFKPGTLKQVRTRLFEHMASDKKYGDGNLKSAKEVERAIKCWISPAAYDNDSVADEIELDLPEGALTREGMVFSYQPYEIDCWAAGNFQFVVPYDKLMPYLTPEAKRLVKSIQ